MNYFKLGFIVLIFAFFIGVGSTQAVTYEYTSIQYPGQSDTILNGMSNSGVVLGAFSPNINVTDTLQQPGTKGFTFDGANWTVRHPSNAITSEAVALNRDGVLIGNYTFNQGADIYTHGFIFKDGVYTDFVTPFANDAAVSDIDDFGNIVGTYSEDFGLGFKLATVGFRALKQPNGTYIYESVPLYEPVEPFDNTLLSGRNNLGQEVGTYVDIGQSGSYGFLLPAGQIANDTTAGSTSLKDINNTGKIVGVARVPAGTDEFFGRGFIIDTADLLDGDPVTFTNLEIPGTGTYHNDGTSIDPNGHRGVQAINDVNVVVGFSDNDDGIYKGFVGVPKTGVAGDFDRDGDADGRDFVLWQRSYGSSMWAGSGADGNSNGIVDAADLAIWQGAYGAGLVAALPVPEPTAWCFALQGVLVMTRACRKSTRR
jgi:hypothetical protein